MKKTFMLVSCSLHLRPGTLFSATLAQTGGLPARRTRHEEAVKMRSIDFFRKMTLVLIAIALVPALVSCANGPSQASEEWQEEFEISARDLTPTGESRYFILSPGFQTVLESENAKVVITVLDETKEIGGITTRVVEEREEKGGRLVEVSRNFFAMDRETGDVFYFGEEVDMYKDGQIVDHAGAWIAYENDNRPGLIVPGTPTVGMKYYQELAPGVAMDRAEVVSVSETFETPAGVFEDCLVTEESSKIEPGVKERKTYAPGIGLVQDETLRLVRYGYAEALHSQDAPSR